VSEIGAEAGFAESLAGLLESATGWRDISIEGLVRVSGGASRDTGSFDAALLESPQGDGLVRSGVTCATLAVRSPTHPEKATP